MRISIFFFLVVFVVVNLSSCKKQQDDLDGKYTISGRLFAGTSDEPLANVPVELEGQREVAISKTEVYSLGSTTTDASGFFSITYDQTHEDGAVKFENGNFVLLRTVQQVGGLVESLPWNKTIQRDFAQRDHSRVFIEVQFNSVVPDTFFLELPLPLNNEDLVLIDLPEIYEGLQKPAFAIPTTGNLLEYEVKLGLGGSWDNSITGNYFYVYGLNRENMRISMMVNAVDSVGDNGQNGPLSLRGFPFTDTLRLNL